MIERAVRGRSAHTFWWDRAGPGRAAAPALRAVIFDVAALSCPGAADRPRAGLADLVLSLFAGGIRLAVVGCGRRAQVQSLVRDLVGDGMAETVVSADDLTEPAGAAGLLRLALTDLGVAGPEVLVIAGAEPARAAAAALGLPVVAAGGCDYAGLSAAGCRRLQAFDAAAPARRS